MNKKEYRAQFKKAREELAYSDVSEREGRLVRSVFEVLPIQDSKYIHVFLPIENKGEIDTWPIIRKIWKLERGPEVVVSKSDFKSGNLTHFILRENTELVTNAWGIPEPVNAEEISPKELDMVFTPLLAFDINGFRVGYGKGFYDRFFGECREDALKVGLSLFLPVPPISDIESHDVRLDLTIIPGKVFRF